MSIEKEKINLLWTGGWESTYRLCNLILLQKRIVSPVYILDESRKSFREEINAITVIQEDIKRRISSDSHLLQPLQIVLKNDIPQNTIITKQYHDIIKSYKRLGSQYEWLARYVVWKGLRCVEIGVEGSTYSPRGPVFLRLENNLIYCDDSLVLCDNPDDPLFEFFRFFSFPLFNMTKSEILKLAKSQSFYDIMLKTWFCHDPRKGMPCGTCRPCQQVMSEDMEFRIPLKGRVRYVIKKKIRFWRQ